MSSTRKFFTRQVENKQFKASILWINDSRIHRNIKIARDNSAVTLGCSDWCGLPFHASERTSEQALIFSLEGRPPWGLLHCDDRRSPWWANRDGPQHDRSRSDTGMISMNFNSYASLVIFFIIPVLFLITKLYLLYECWLCLIFITAHKLAIQLSVKTSKTLTVHVVFSLRIFVSAHVIIT